MDDHADIHGRNNEHRFAAGWRLITSNGTQPDPTPDLVVDIIRPDDLVSLSVAGYDVELVTGEDPLIRAGSDDARLVIGFSYQHLGEEAIYEEEEPETVSPPVGAIPARGSRLVFELEEDEEIEFTTSGILSAIGRLRLVTHPLAKPRGRALPVPPGPILHLPDDIVAVPGPLGVVLTRATARTRAPEAGAAVALARRARDMRRMRDLLTYSTGAAVRLDEEEIRRIVDTPGLIFPDYPIPVPRRPRLSRPTETLETKIEAPFRLEISPSDTAGWVHAVEPVTAEGADHRIELWHTRLGVWTEVDEEIIIDERNSRQRIVRAVWARDREAMPDWENERTPTHDNLPFRMSLDSADRHMLVRQTSETWIGEDGPVTPEPVDARAVWLSAWGAWLDLNGRWETEPYTTGADPMSAIGEWEHVAPMGRDQYVRVEYPGYLFPFGHKTDLIKVTERKMKEASPSVASLYQRKFLKIGEPTRWFDLPNLPFTEVRLAPTVTPTLDPDFEDKEDEFWFPSVGGKRFQFILHCVDVEGRRVRLQAPLLWVAASYRPFSDVDTFYSTDPEAPNVPASGQEVAYAPVAVGGDTMLPTDVFTFAGTAEDGTSTPELTTAAVVIQSVEQLSPVGPISIEYAEQYLDHGFGGTQNAGEVWAKVLTPPELKFGDAGAGSDKAGGFIQPNLMIDGLSRVKGMVGDIESIATGGFDPGAFLAQLELPKLFGIVDLLDVLAIVGIDINDAPSIVTETLERIEGFIADLERAKAMVEEAVAEAEKLVDRAVGKAQELQDQADAALQAAEDLKDEIEETVDEILSTLDGLANATRTDIETALEDLLDDLRDRLAQIRVVAPQLPPLIGQRLSNLADVLEKVANAADLIDDLFNFLNGLAGGAINFTFRFVWAPKMRSWPESDPILELKEDSFALAVEGRASGQDGMSVDALAELRDFTLNLLPGADLVRFKFDHLSFRAGSTGKPDVDVVLNDIEFVGILAFVEVLKELIPFDGFSDPPFLDVTTEGLTAGFTQGLPNVAVGVFNLSNISLGADVQVPFLGKSVTVGFDFCTRDRPMTLAVLFIGGGGWFGIRLSPDGLDVLELGLEAGAVLAVDFGVASGSISAMLGIYMRLEADEGSLAGYFRLRGEVDVLGLISASIELYLELLYEFDTGKMVGSATITVEVEVLFFSTSVSIRAERRFAGSNGDPNFEDVMGLEADGTSPAWSEYCLAFAAA